MNISALDSTEELNAKFEKERRYIQRSLDPISIIDEAIELEGILFIEHYNISKAQNRSERVKLLFEVIEKLPHGKRWRILIPIFNHVDKGKFNSFFIVKFMSLLNLSLKPYFKN